MLTSILSFLEDLSYYSCYSCERAEYDVTSEHILTVETRNLTERYSRDLCSAYAAGSKFRVVCSVTLGIPIGGACN